MNAAFDLETYVQKKLPAKRRRALSTVQRAVGTLQMAILWPLAALWRPFGKVLSWTAVLVMVMLRLIAEGVLLVLNTPLKPAEVWNNSALKDLTDTG